MKSILLLRPLQVTLLAVILLQGCISGKDSYQERHEVRNLTVVFLDEASLHQEWRKRTGNQPVQLVPQMRDGSFASVKTLRGFYDFSTSTPYCPKWNFEVCGHELHHAVLGQFHADD